MHVVHLFALNVLIVDQYEVVSGCGTIGGLSFIFTSPSEDLISIQKSDTSSMMNLTRTTDCPPPPPPRHPLPPLHHHCREGYYVGSMSSAFMVGRLLSAYGWGILSDRWGRRPVLLCGLGSIAVLSVAFGLSTSLAWAIICRQVRLRKDIWSRWCYVHGVGYF